MPSHTRRARQRAGTGTPPPPADAAGAQVKVFPGEARGAHHRRRRRAAAAGTKKANTRAADTLARVLPRLATHDAVATETLAAHVSRTISKLSKLDALAPGLPGAETLSLELHCCARVAEGIPDDATGSRLKSRLLSHGALRHVTTYLLDVAFKDAFARLGGGELDKTSDAWRDACAKPALTYALSSLRGVGRVAPARGGGVRGGGGDGDGASRRG